jgi:hypothetical protein
MDVDPHTILEEGVVGTGGSTFELYDGNRSLCRPSRDLWDSLHMCVSRISDGQTATE